MMKRVRKKLVWTLIGLEIVLVAVEQAVTLGPLLHFFPQIADYPELLGLVGLLVLVWSVSLRSSLAPLLRPGTLGPKAIRDHIRMVPGRVMILRLCLWALAGTIGVIYLREQGAIAGDQIATVLAIGIAHSFAISLLRLALTMPLLRRALRQLGLAGDWPQEQSETLFDRLTEVAMVTGAASGACSALFVYLFVPMTEEQYLRLQTYFPLTITALAQLWYFVGARRQIAPLIAYFKAASSDELDPELLQRARDSAHRLPAVATATKVAWFGAAALLLLAEAVWIYDFSVIQAVFVASSILLVAIGFGIYQFIWIHAVLRPIVSYLMDQPGPPKAPVRALSLRAKMLVLFGGLTVFCVSLALFWTYLQYGNLRSDFAAAQARRELAQVLTLVSRVRPATPARIRATVRGLTPAAGSRYFYLAPSGAVDPLLPSTDVATIRRRKEGAIEIADHGISGTYRRIFDGQPELGSVLVMIPLNSSAKVTLNVHGLIWFFSIVLAMSLGLVLITSARLTQPLVDLERRATEMADGELDHRVDAAGEYDEIGRLRQSFEKMRRALREKIQTIEELNVGLEEKVSARTSELEERNQALAAVIDELRQTQAQLLTSEKLASVGQLIAGIAHEINNPINALANTISPLQQTISQIVDPERDAPARRELQRDAEEMLAVLRSATERTKRIVNALRNYTRSDGEEATTVDLHFEIDETLALLAHKLRGIEVRRDYAMKGELEALRGPLDQALLNVIANACDALVDSPDATLVITTAGDEERVTITIADNGPGIPAALRGRIFDPFFTTKPVGAGTGLGLSITFGIIERHGGTIAVDSDEGGSRFTITLPRRG